MSGQRSKKNNSDGSPLRLCPALRLVLSSHQANQLASNEQRKACKWNPPHSGLDLNKQRTHTDADRTHSSFPPSCPPCPRIGIVSRLLLDSYFLASRIIYSINCGSTSDKQRIESLPQSESTKPNPGPPVPHNQRRRLRCLAQANLPHS